MRRIALRGCAGLFAVSWILLPGFGAFDLAVTWSDDWPQALEAGWGLFATVVVGAAFAAVAVRPRLASPAVLQLAVAALALGASAIVAEERRLLWFAAGLVTQIVILGALSERIQLGRPQLSSLLLLLGVLGAVPWVVYAAQMWTLNRQGRTDADITIGVDHYSMQGALGLSLAVLPLLAAVQPPVRRFAGVCVGIAAGYLALISIAWPDAAGSLTKTWSIAAAVWALALVAAAGHESQEA